MHALGNNIEHLMRRSLSFDTSQSPQQFKVKTLTFMHQLVFRQSKVSISELDTLHHAVDHLGQPCSLAIAC